MLATTALPVAPATPLDDDAGSGRDAGWGRDDAVRIAPGTHHGTLTSLPDRADAFIVHAEAGLILRVNAEVTRISGDGAPVADVRVNDPFGNGVQPWSPSNASDGHVERYVTVPGDWLIIVDHRWENAASRTSYALTVELVEPQEDDAGSGRDAGEAAHAAPLPDGASRGFLHRADHVDEYRLPVSAGESFAARVTLDTHGEQQREASAWVLDDSGRALTQLTGTNGSLGTLWTSAEDTELILRVGFSWDPRFRSIRDPAYPAHHEDLGYALTLTREHGLPPDAPRPATPVRVEFNGTPRDVTPYAGGVAVAAESGLWTLDALGNRTRVTTSATSAVTVDGDGDFITTAWTSNASSPHLIEHVSGNARTPIIASAHGDALMGPDGLLIVRADAVLGVNESRDVHRLWVDDSRGRHPITTWAYDGEGRLHGLRACPLVSPADACADAGNTLVRVDFASRNVTSVTPLPRGAGTFAFDGTGNVYYPDGNGGLVAWNASTHDTRRVATGVGAVAKLAVADGKLWFIEFIRSPSHDPLTSRLGYVPLDLATVPSLATPFTPDPLPDLTVERVDAYPGFTIGFHPDGVERQNVTVTFANVGDGWMTGGLDVVLEARCVPAAASACEDEEVQRVHYSSMPRPGESVSVTMPWDRTLRAGDYELVATLQLAPGVFESDRSNNAGSTTTSARVAGTGSLL